MEDFVNSAEKGFIYISFGTAVEFTSFERDVQLEFIQALYAFPELRFLWKASKGLNETLPENVMITKWAPQQTILGTHYASHFYIVYFNRSFVSISVFIFCFICYDHILKLWIFSSSKNKSLYFTLRNGIYCRTSSFWSTCDSTSVYSRPGFECQCA